MTMKKTLFIAVLAAAAVSAISCQKQDINTAKSGLTSITAGFDDTKVVVEGLKSYWTEDDSLALYDGGGTLGAEYTTDIYEKTAVATFDGCDAVKFNNGTDPEYYMAFYPYCAVNTSKKWTTGYVYFGIPHEQIAVKNGFPEGSIILYARSETTEFAFSHVNAYIKFTFDASSPSIKSINIKDNSLGKLTGDMRIPNGTGKVQASSLGSAVTYPDVTLKTSDGSAFQPGVYYVAVRPMTFATGLTFTFTGTDGRTGTKSFSASKSLSSGEIADLGTVKNIEFPAFEAQFPEFKYSNSRVFTSFGLTSRYFSIISTKSWTAAVGSETTASGVTLKTTSGSGSLDKFEVTCGQNTDFANRKKIVIEFTLDGGKIEKVELEQEKASIIELECRNLENKAGLWPFDGEVPTATSGTGGPGTLSVCGYTFGYWGTAACCFESSFGWRIGGKTGNYFTTPAISGKKLKQIIHVDSNDKAKLIQTTDGTDVAFTQAPATIVGKEPTTFTITDPQANTSYRLVITKDGTIRTYYLKLIYE